MPNDVYLVIPGDVSPGPSYLKMKVCGRTRSRYGWIVERCTLWVPQHRLTAIEHSIEGWSRVKATIYGGRS